MTNRTRSRTDFACAARAAGAVRRALLRGACLVGVVSCLVGAPTAAFAGPADARLPVPDAAARTAAAAELKKEFAEGLRSEDPEVRRTLARSLVERAAAADVDPVKRYALLDEAVTLAEGLRDVRLTLDGVDRLAGAFQVTRASLGVPAIEAVANGAKEPGVLGEAAWACIDLAGDALAADDPETAGRLLASAQKLAADAKLGGLRTRASAISDFVPSFGKLSTAADAARATLAATPDDPAARETLGRFLAFGRGQWDEGLPELAKSGDAALAKLAALDLARPRGAAGRQALADGWWERAQGEADPLAKARMLARAVAIDATAPAAAQGERAKLSKARADSVTYWAWNRSVALTKDFSKDGPSHLALATIRGAIAQAKVDRRRDGWRLRLPRFPDVAFDPGEEYFWRLDTNQGAIVARLFSDTAPRHVANLLYLTELGFYDGLTFHRVIPEFMAQGGCPKGDGSGTPGYVFDGELGSDRKHDRAGLLSAVNFGDPSSDGSQFFLTFAPADHLDGKHTIFGEVVEGMDAVRKLEGEGTPDEGTPKSRLVILGARVVVR